MKRRRVASNPRREFWTALREMQRRFEESQQRAEEERQRADRERQQAERERAQARKRDEQKWARIRERAAEERQQAERERAQARKRDEQKWARIRERAERDMEDLRERQRQTDAQLRRSELLFTGHWGKLVESLVEGDLARLLRGRGVEVALVASRVELVLDPRRREIDLLAANGEDVVAVEVKTTLRVADVRRFLELLHEVRELLPIALRRLRIYGAVAYLRTEEEATRFAERRGLFVIRATGNSASITNARDFRPHEFGRPVPSA